MSGRPPSFIGIGAEKCATTWLTEVLRDHPEIYMSSPKELHFFTDHWTSGKSWYFRHFDTRASKVAGEFSTSYLPSLVAPNRIKEIAPNAALLCMVRDPVERFMSHAKHLCRDGRLQWPRQTQIDQPWLDQAVGIEPRLLESSLYGKHLSRFRQILPEARILIVPSPATAHDGIRIVREVYSFLGVSPDAPAPTASKVVSKGVVPRWQSLESAKKKGFRALNRINPSVITVARRAGLGRLYRNINTRSMRPGMGELSTGGRAYLQSLFDSDKALLCNLIESAQSPWSPSTEANRCHIIGESGR